MKQKKRSQTQKPAGRKVLKELSRREVAKERALFKKNTGQKEANRYRRMLNHLRLEKPRYWWKERGIFQKIALILCAIVILCVAGMYGIAQWYIYSQKNKE